MQVIWTLDLLLLTMQTLIHFAFMLQTFILKAWSTFFVLAVKAWTGLEHEMRVRKLSRPVYEAL